MAYLLAVLAVLLVSPLPSKIASSQKHQSESLVERDLMTYTSAHIDRSLPVPDER